MAIQKPHTILLAIGGNALVKEGESGNLDRQMERANEFAQQVAELYRQGYSVVVTHGNGPQVGYIMRRGELVANVAAAEGLPAVPLWMADADSQGGIGHLISFAIDSALSQLPVTELDVPICATLLTHTVVDETDPSFNNPTKPIGGTMSAEQAAIFARELGWSVKQVSDQYWRRVVASPKPKQILEEKHLMNLLDSHTVVIAGGGGGIPLVYRDNQYVSVDAVIDKDRVAAILARDCELDTLVLVTGVDAVYVDWDKPTQKRLDSVTTDVLRDYLADGQFPAGSMGPKIESALAFVDRPGKRAIITSIENLIEALEGKCGTTVIFQ